MSTLGKVIVGIIVALGLVCVVTGVILYAAGMITARVIDNVVENDPQKVEATAAQIADVTLPDGYVPDYAVNISGYMAASYTPGDDHSHLFLIQGPAGLSIDQDKLEEMAKNNNNQSNYTKVDVKIVEKRQATVRGQDATITTSEGINSEGQPFREVTVFFQGKGGPALIIIEEPLTRWDQDKIDAFVDSIQ